MGQVGEGQTPGDSQQAHRKGGSAVRQGQEAFRREMQWAELRQAGSRTNPRTSQTQLAFSGCAGEKGLEERRLGQENDVLWLGVNEFQPGARLTVGEQG